MVNPLWNHYKCKDGQWLALGMLQTDRHWPSLCKALGIEHLEKDPRFENMNQRAENCEALISILDGVFITKSRAEWLSILKESSDLTYTPVQSLSDLVNDPQVLANDYIIDYHHSVLGLIKAMGIPFQLSRTPGMMRCESPEFGQHTEEILIELGGYSWEEITLLREQEVI